MNVDVMKCEYCGSYELLVDGEWLTPHGHKGGAVSFSVVLSRSVPLKPMVGPAITRRPERKRIADSIGKWMKEKAVYVTEKDPGRSSVLMVASDLMNGEWDEDTLGGTIEP